MVWRKRDMSGVRIRAALPVDSKEISELITGLSEKFITEEFSSRGKDHLLSTMTSQSIEKYMRSSYRYHVAETDNRLVGVVAVKDNKHLYHLFVAEQYQRRGIAKKLWKVAMEIGVSKGNTGEFTVNSSAYARRIYEQLGFVKYSGSQVKNDVVFYPMKLTINRHR
jgi:ribosomal protein S18 acetylase RimI-like enzyme